MLAVAVLGLVAIAYGLPTGYDSEQQPIGFGTLENARWRRACPPYQGYASMPHQPFSKGPLKLPFQRPAPECRTFHSPAVEQVIADLTSRMVNPDMARIFENAFPNTLDTTISWHDTGDGRNRRPGKATLASRMPLHVGLGQGIPAEKPAVGPASFIVTGDITAEWLRDSTNQLQAYHVLATKDPALRALIVGAIATQAEYVLAAPYCNAFQPPADSGLPPGGGVPMDRVHPAFDPAVVFECKWELDSLAHFLRLGNEYHAATGARDFVTKQWLAALDTVMDVVTAQQQPTFNSTSGAYLGNEYTFERTASSSTETLALHGLGNPVANGTGLVRSAFRPSDDATILPFLIPANAMMVVELRRAALLLADSHPAQAAELSTTAATIEAGIQSHGIVEHPQFGRVYAYEVDGYGSHVLMDDANVPSLLSLPLLGYVSADDPVYRNTRRMLLSPANPYFLRGKAFAGIGGPHVGLHHAWPMSVLVQALTADNADEVADCLRRVASASRLGLIHESVHVAYEHDYTRPWFAWANSVFAQTVLRAAERWPSVIFEEGATAYRAKDVVVASTA